VLRRSLESGQYVALAFTRRLDEAEIAASMGAVGTAYDNAVAESLFATINRELVHRHRYPTRAAARAAIFEFIEVFYNRRRLHSSIGYLSPETFERRVREEREEVPVAYPERVHASGSRPSWSDGPPRRTRRSSSCSGDPLRRPDARPRRRRSRSCGRAARSWRLTPRALPAVKGVPILDQDEVKEPLQRKGRWNRIIGQVAESCSDNPGSRTRERPTSEWLWA
jgi:hypothetical protein